MRPTTSYSADGRTAYCDGRTRSDCPYNDRSLKGLDWTIGFLDAAVNDFLRMDMEEGRDPLDITPIDVDREALSAVVRCRERLVDQTESLLPAMSAIEARIGSASDWPARCWEIAKRLLDSRLLAPLEAIHGPATLCYGNYTGYISRDSIFASRPIARHGWLEFESGLVADPTAWVFEASTPSITLTSIDDYDLANRRLVWAFKDRRPVPEFDEETRTIQWDVNDPDLVDLADSLLGEKSKIRERGVISFAQAMWLGGLPISAFGEHAAPMYRNMERMGLGATIPVDNRIYAGTVQLPASDDENDLVTPRI